MTKPRSESAEPQIKAFLATALERQGLGALKSKKQSLSELGLIDSLFLIDLTLFLETTFGLDFSKQEITPLDVDTLEQITKLVEDRLAS